MDAQQQLTDKLLPNPGPPTATRPAAAEPIHLAIRSKAELYAAWIGIFRNGGLFVPTPERYSLGDELRLLLTLYDNPTPVSFHASVAWVNPASPTGMRPQGVGVHMREDEVCRAISRRIVRLLTGVLESSRPTHTI